MTKSEVYQTWRANYLPYLIAFGKGDDDKACEISLHNWIDTLVETGNITKEQSIEYKS